MTTTSSQAKSLWVNNSLTILTTSNGSKATVPEFYYNSYTLLQFHIRDNSGNIVDLSGATFEFIIAEDYNGAILLTVADGDFDHTNIATGDINCIADFNQSPIQSYLDDEHYKTAQCSLWATISGVDYLLVAFKCDIYNTVY